MKSLLSWFILLVSIVVLVSSCSSSEESQTGSTDNPTTSNDNTTKYTILMNFMVVILNRGLDSDIQLLSDDSNK